MKGYEAFLEGKAQLGALNGFEPSWSPDFLFPFQHALVDWAARMGRSAMFDVIDRALVLWTNPGETVLTPFMGVGSEVYASVVAGRRGVGVELKASYYRQAVKNLAEAGKVAEQQRLGPMFGATA